MSTMTQQENARYQGYQRLLKAKLDFPAVMHIVHGDTIQYDMNTYGTSKTKIICLCTLERCKCIWWATPSMLKRGDGCPTCSKREKTKRMYIYNNKAISIAKSTIEDRIHSLHRGSILVTNIDTYIGNRHPIAFKCNACEYTWSAKPSNVLSGSGCPICASSGFKIGEPAILYLLDLGNSLYKLGITNRSIKDRYSYLDRSKIVKSYQKSYTLGVLALAEETRLKKEYKEFRYNGPSILESGNTEIFITNLFELGGVLF